MQKFDIFYLKVAVFCLLLISSTVLSGQDNQKSITAQYVTDEIHLDGNLYEPIWQSADVADDFWQFFPKDNVKAEYPTEVRVVYNETTLYIGIRAAAPNNDFVVTSLKRDFSGTQNDNVTLVFDTFNDGTNAYAFGVTPFGVRREILIANGGATRESFNLTWDVKWKAESKIYDNYYTVEVAIPFSSIKFEEGATKWRFRPYRWSVQTNEQTTWTRVPQTQLLANVAFMGELIFEKPLGKSRTPLAVIPYVNTLVQKDFNMESPDFDFLVGGDAKVAIGDGMNLDLTFNPDFSNVEVDDIFTNLTRFELLLPERRQFFIDNSDLFASFGNYFREARPFFSRRIGLARDTSGNLIQNRIIGGARLSGKLNENWRLGILNMQTAADEGNEISSNNNMMFALQRKVASRSNVGVFMVNRQTFGDYDFVENNQKYNRVIGADYNLATADNAWSGRFYVHKSFNPDDTKGNYSAQAIATYNKNDWVFISDWVYVDNDFQADLGFVPRTDIFKMGNFAQRFFYPKNRNIINRQNAQLLFINYFRPTLDFKLSDYLFRATWETEFKNQAMVTANYSNQYIYLTNGFDPTQTDSGVPLLGDIGYTFNQANIVYTSNNSNLLTYSFNTTLGEFFNGNRYSIGGTAAYRIQPWAQFSLNVNYDGIRLPDPHPSVDFWLFTPRFDITFSKSVFWTTLIQYSNQRENLGINSRLQWRFAPLSDLYLVYNDNYYTTDFSLRFRSINLKVSYWLNL
jgi:hypothetical protein